MPATYIMCGLAFSGKSSAARIIAAELGASLISLDAINHERGLRGGEGISIDEWERTSHIAMERLVSALAADVSAVVDDTFSHRFLRDRARFVAEKCGSRFVVLYMDTPIDVIERRRAENYRNPTRHHVRDDVFAAHRDGFQHPDLDEPVFRIQSEAALRDWLVGERNLN